MSPLRSSVCAILFAASPAPVLAGTVLQTPDSIDVLNTPLEELGKIPVVSASRRAESLQDVASAAYVLTNEDLMRSGARHVAEALRLVPGVEVSRADAGSWAVSIRGFHSTGSNKLLVLIDGRSIYDPLFSGVFWETVDMPLALIERIEVVRGPGGAQWGANAVNGVINIITRQAGDVPRLGVVAGGGDFEGHFLSVHGSGGVGGATLAAYAKATERGPSAGPGDPGDEVDHVVAGLRGDVDLDQGDVMFKLEAYEVDAGDRATPSPDERSEHSGSNATLQWHARGADGVERWASGYLDTYELDTASIDELRDTADVEYRQIHGRDDGQFTWGLGYRITSDELTSPLFVLVDDPTRTDETWSAFVERQWHAGDDGRDRITLGTKLERNDYTGVEWQPSVRYAHKHDDEATSWGALSRAVRIPSRLESDISVPPAIVGNPDMQAETLVAFELGHRRPFGGDWWASFAGYVNVYDELQTVEAGVVGNGMLGRAMGGELTLRWQPGETLRGDFAYGYVDLDLELDGGSAASPATPANIEGNSARHRLALRLAWDPAPAFGIDGAVRHVSRLQTQDVDPYTVLDLRLAWRPLETLELALVGRDLLRGAHYEQRTAASTLIEPSGYVMLRWRL